MSRCVPAGSQEPEADQVERVRRTDLERGVRPDELKEDARQADVLADVRLGPLDAGKSLDGGAAGAALLAV